MTLEQAIAEWKELNIDKCEVEFDCGGDDMGDTEFHFFSNGVIVTNVSQELQDFVENKMYDNVTFYQNSNGHYIGESGTVMVGLEEDDEEPYFVYSKSSTAEYSEIIHTFINVELTKEQVDFIKKNVTNIFGNFDEETQIVYKHDFILTDNDEMVEDELKTLLFDTAEGTYPDIQDDSEVQEWFAFSAVDEEHNIEELTIKADKLKIMVRRNVTTYEPSDW